MIVLICLCLLASCDDGTPHDITPPGEVTELRVEVKGSSHSLYDIVLTWKNPDDEDLVSVEIAYTFRNDDESKSRKGVESISSSIETYTFTSVESGSLCSITLTTVDGAGNRSTGVNILVPPGVKSFTSSCIDNGISLSWNHTDSKFFKGTELVISSVEGESVMSFDASVSSYLFSSGIGGEKYAFTIYALYEENGIEYRGRGESLDVVYPLPAVSSLIVSPGDGKIHLSWNKTENMGSCSLSLEIKTSDERKVISLSGDTVSYDFTEGKHGSMYEFTICTCRDVDGETLNGESVSVSSLFYKYSLFENPIMVITLPDGVDDITTKTWLEDMNLDSARCEIIDNSSEKNNDTFNVDIKGRGNSSWGMIKKSYSVKLEEKRNLFGIADGKHKNYALIANYADKSLIRNRLAYYMGTEIFTYMDWNPHTIEVNLIVNGRYYGVYLLTERIKINKNIVNITDISEKEDGGWIVEVNARLDETYNWTTLHGVPISLKDPDDWSGWEKIRDYIDSVEEVLYGDNYTDAEDGWRKYLDEDSFVDWYLVNETAKNNDAAWYSSVYMYYNPEDGKIHMGPLWDFDIGFGNINYNGCDNPEGFWIKGAGWYARLFTDPEFIEAVKTRWKEKKAQIDNLSAIISSYSLSLERDAAVNFTLYPILGLYVWPNASGFETRTTYLSEVGYLSNWLERRIEWLDKNINSL